MTWLLALLRSERREAAEAADLDVFLLAALTPLIIESIVEGLA